MIHRQTIQNLFIGAINPFCENKSDLRVEFYALDGRKRERVLSKSRWWRFR